MHAISSRSGEIDFDHTTVSRAGPIEHVVLMAVFQKAKDFQATDLTLPQARTAILEAVDIAGIGLDEGILSSPSPRETIPDSEMGLEVKENKVR